MHSDASLGNILTQTKKDEQGKLMENLTYQYAKQGNQRVQNRLYHVARLRYETVAAADYPDDIDEQGTFTPDVDKINSTNNYSYDELGQLKSDKQEDIKEIFWTLSGKVSYISRTFGGNKYHLHFKYDALGNRISKEVISGNGASKQTEYYIRDAQGNLMAMYKLANDNVNQTQSFAVTERPIYGSSRIGVDNTKEELLNIPPPFPFRKSRILGNKNYELSNHLGSVLVTVSDRKIPIDLGNNGSVDYYTADVTSANDLYSFGSIMPGRNFSSNAYRFGFGSHEKDDEVKGTGNHLSFGDYGYDPRTGQRWTIDKKASEMPNWSPYTFAKRNPILYLDADGEFPYTFHIRSFAPTGSFKGTGFHDDGRGYSTSTNVTSRIKQQFTVDPTAKTFSGGKPTSDPTYWNGINQGTATNTGGASAEFGKNSLGSATASIGANFEGSNPSPIFMGAAPAIQVSSAISITENLKTNQVFVSLDLSSKQFPATEGLLQDNAGNTLFLAGAAAYGTAANLVRADKKPIASVDLIIGINDKGVFQNVTMGDKTYTIEEFNR